MAFGTFTLTGHFDAFGEAPASGKVRIDGLPQVIKDTAGNKIKVGPKTAVLDQLGNFSINLPSDATTGNSTSIAFRVTTDLKGLANIPPTDFYARPISTTVDLADIVPEGIPEPVGETAANAARAEAAADEAEAASIAAQAVGTTNDAVMASRVSDSASSTYSALLGVSDAITARALGYRIVTDKAYAGGADKTGATDSTAAIDAACSGSLSRKVWFPEGTYQYNGNGIEIRHLTVQGAGQMNTKIVLGAGKTLFVGAATPGEFHVADLNIDGGLNHIYVGATGNSIANHRVIERIRFSNYTGTAITSMMNDNPYWMIRDCVFVSSGDQAGQVGIAMLRNYDNAFIWHNEFLENEIHLKLGNNGSTCKVIGNEFIRNNGTASAGRPRIDVWVVNANTNVGQAHFNTNKFGNENLIPGDYRVLIADEDPASGADFGTRKGYLLTQSASTRTSYLNFHDNQIHGSTGNGPFIVSTVPGTTGIHITDSTILGTPPTAMIDVLFPATFGTSMANIVGPTSWNSRVSAYKTFRPILACTKPGYVTLIDPNGVHASPDVPTSWPGAAANAGTVVLAAQPLSAFTLVGTATRTGITDATGGTNAATITTTATSDYISLVVAGMATGVPTWLEFDVRLTPGGTPAALASITASFEQSNTGLAGRTVALTTGWRTVRIPFTPGAAVPDRIKFIPGGDLSSQAGQFDIGRVFVYQSPEPANVSGQFNVAGTWTTVGSGGGGGVTYLDARRTTDAAAVNNNSTTLVQDGVLSVTLAANSTYEVECAIYYDATTTADMKLGFVVPSGATGSWTPDALAVTGTTINRGTIAWTASTAFGGLGAGTVAMGFPKGTITTGGTGGTFAVRYSQNTAEVSDLIVRADSRIRLRKIA